MRRIGVLILMLALLPAALLLAGCGEASAVMDDKAPDATVDATTAVPADDVAPPTVTMTGGPYPSTDPTAQGVLLGPAAAPAATDDVAPRLFSDEPAIRDTLQVELPLLLAIEGDEYVLGDHLILVLNVAGAAESQAGIEVYGDMWEQWFLLDRWQPMQGTGSVCPVRIRLTRDGDVFRIDGVDRPQDGEGYGRSLDEMLPGWVRDRVDGQDSRDRMREALWTAAAGWVRPNVPADLFVDQPPAAMPDPHGHQPPPSEYRMLAAKYVECGLPEITPPSKDDYQAEFGYPSEDGRFRLFFLLSGRGVAVEDTQSGEWRSIGSLGQPTLAVSPGTFDPVWLGHTLFIDFATIMDPFQPTLTHYEIDFDSMTVVRVVPMGPLSFNEAR